MLASRPHRRPTSARLLLHRRSATSVSTTARASQSCRPYPAITRPTIETIIRQQTSADEVEVEGGRIILTPVRKGGAEAVREKLASLGIGKDDVSEAIRWARRP